MPGEMLHALLQILGMIPISFRNKLVNPIQIFDEHARRLATVETHRDSCSAPIAIPTIACYREGQSIELPGKLSLVLNM